MSEVKVNKISPRTNCGTVQLGDSGDTITIPAGATIVNNGTQTGFGRTGTVDWDTTAKTASFTAVSGNGYFVNTTSGAITVTLPATPSAGDIVSIADYTNTFQTNNVTVARNGSNIGGVAADAILSTEGQSVTFIYVDGTEGWKNVQDSTSNVTGNPFIVATGGTITTCGNCKIHTFTGPGTFCVSSAAVCAANNEVSYLVVAGGGSSAGNGAFANTTAGGGAGGFREDKSPVTPYTASPLDGAGPITVTATSFPITVGGGGTGGPSSPPHRGAPGSNSIFSTITSTGGGTGGHDDQRLGDAGGSGGGTGGGSNNSGCRAAGNTPPTSPAQGQPGGSSPVGPPDSSSGGGGGATQAGQDANTPSPNIGGNGGNGATTSISGTPTAYGGGGGGGSGGSPGSGGTGGGGTGGGPSCGGSGTSGTTNTGGGAGGRSPGNPSFGGPGCGANGGSGIVIIRYKYQ